MYFQFLLIGLLNAIFAEIAIVPTNFVAEWPGTILLHIIFLSCAFVVSKVLVSRIRNRLREYVFFYLLFGFLGLLVIEWLLLGNLIVHPIPILNAGGQLFMFSFWAGVGLIPKTLLDNRLKKTHRRRFLKRIAGFFLVFIGIGFIVYLSTNDFETWKFFVAAFYISLNYVFIKHFREVRYSMRGN